MHSRASVVVAAASGVATLLSGCGESGKTTPAPSPTGPTSPCKEGNDAECAKFLNEQYMGYDKMDSKSPIGVTMRGRPRYSDESEDPCNMWCCSHSCYNGQPDCYVPAALYNHKMVLTEKNTMEIYADTPIQIVFQPDAVMNTITKCAYKYDGAAFNKNFGGCGVGAPSQNCDDSADSAFNNMCPSDPTKPADAECPEVIEGTCDGMTEADHNYPVTCSWRGPAWYSATQSDSMWDKTRQGELNELRNMVTERMDTQGFDKQCGDTTCTNYWNEIVTDGRILDVLMDEDPAQLIAAFAYPKGDAQSLQDAQKFNDRLFNKSSIRVPIIAIDMEAPVDSVGPFGLPEEAEQLV